MLRLFGKNLTGAVRKEGATWHVIFTHDGAPLVPVTAMNASLSRNESP
jgi:hypothetical protein